MPSNETTTISGGGFHCKILLDLKEVRSIRRHAFWNNGWWYTCTKHDNSIVDIHVHEKIDVIALFEGLNGKRKSN